MFKSVYFFNHFNSGDIHISRSFIKNALENVKNVDFHYGHKNNQDLLLDIDIKTDNNKYLKLKNGGIFNRNEKWFIYDDVLYINTWYFTDNYKYINIHNFNFDCLLHLFRDTFLECFNYDIFLTDIKHFFPVIDFDRFEIDNAKKYFNNYKNCFKVLICNGAVLSGQANNLNWQGVILNLAKTFPNVLFMITSKLNFRKNNIIFTGDIIKKNGTDLNENAYISTKANIIIGRCSGPYTFSYNYVNLFERNCDMVSFADFENRIGNFFLGDYCQKNINYSCSLTNYKNQELGFVVETVSNLIRRVS